MRIDVVRSGKKKPDISFSDLMTADRRHSRT
jgi:hypothetical protein